MKRLLALALVAALGGCSTFAQKPSAPAPARQPAKPAKAAGTPIERVPFRVGVSSATVEKLAQTHACTGGQGAGLITEPGPVEVYRMHCADGKVFMARCELRQCKKM